MYSKVMPLQWVYVCGLSVTHDEAFFYVASKARFIFLSWYFKTGQTCGAKTWQGGELRYYPLPWPFRHAKHLPASIRCCISSEMSNIPRPELLPHQYGNRSIAAWKQVHTLNQTFNGNMFLWKSNTAILFHTLNLYNTSQRSFKWEGG